MPNTFWVVSELYYPEETSTGFILTRIAEGLAHLFRVNVLCGQPSYAFRGLKAPRRETCNGATIERCPSIVLNKDRLVSRLIHAITISASIFVCAFMRIKRNDTVLVVTNPPTLPHLVSWACRIRGARCLLLIHDVYPEVLIEAGLFKPRSMVPRLFDHATRHLYRSVRRIVVLGRDMKKLIERKLGRTDRHPLIIPNWADSNEIRPAPFDQNEMARRLGLADKFVVQYAGNMGRTHDLESLVESAHLLLSRDDIHFLFVGSGAKRLWLADVIRSRNIRNATLLSYQPRRDLNSLLNACHLSIISLVPGMSGISVPSRMYNVMASGKPILAVADPDSELARVVLEERIGWVVPPRRPDEIARLIRDAADHPQELVEMAQRARAAAEQKYSFESAIESYRVLIQGVIDECR